MKQIKVPWVSKSRLNRAGEHLRDVDLLLDEDLIILEEWRAAHKHLLNSFQSILRNRRRKRDIVIAQRLKRRWAIADKLAREPKMRLARMDDVAGCRLIFPSIKTLNNFRHEMLTKTRFKHERRNEEDRYNYIDNPKSTRYRGIHDIYIYRTDSVEYQFADGLMLELQYRTKPQHAWATAVEVITRITENQPKFGRGDSRYQEYFRLTSEIISRTQESMVSCCADLSNDELLEMFYDVDRETGIQHILQSITVSNIAEAFGGNVILRYAKEGELNLHAVPPGKSPTELYFELEEQYKEDDIVLVKADTFAEIRTAYRNYFSDTQEFLQYVSDGCDQLKDAR